MRRYEQQWCKHYQFDGGYSVTVGAKCYISYISNALWGTYQIAEGELKYSINKMYIATNSTPCAMSIKMCVTTQCSTTSNTGKSET